MAVWPQNYFSSLLKCPQGPQRCQKEGQHSLNRPLEVWRAKIDPKLNKLQKTVKIENKSSTMPVVWILFNLGPILVHQIFYGVSIVEIKEFLDLFIDIWSFKKIHTFEVWWWNWLLLAVWPQCRTLLWVVQWSFWQLLLIRSVSKGCQKWSWSKCL